MKKTNSYSISDADRDKIRDKINSKSVNEWISTQDNKKITKERSDYINGVFSRAFETALKGS